MSKKIALSLGLATLVSMSAVGGASAADRSAMIDAIHANQAATRMEVAQLVARHRATAMPIRSIALEARIHAKQAQTRMEVARLIEKSRQQHVGLVALAYEDRAQQAAALQNQLAKKNPGNAPTTSDIDG